MPNRLYREKLNKLDLHRLRSNRYSSNKLKDDENFSVSVAQFMYKLDNIDAKLKKSLSKIEELCIEKNKTIQDHIEDDVLAELNIQNKLLQERVTEIECKYHQSISSSLNLLTPNDRTAQLKDQIKCLKEVHSTELTHCQTSYEKTIYELKQSFKQKEQRLQERINHLTRPEQDLSLIQDLQQTLDRIHFIAEPTFRQQICNYPDYREIKGEPKEIIYVDFLSYLAKQTIGLINQINVSKTEQSIKCDANKDCVVLSNLRIDNQNLYPSVANLLGNEQNNVQFRKNMSTNSSVLVSSKSSSTITEDDLQKAIRAQNEFQKQSKLLFNEDSTSKLELNDLGIINSHTLSRQNVNPILSQKVSRKSSMKVGIKSKFKSQKNLTFGDEEQFASVSEGNFTDKVKSLHKLSSQEKSKNKKQKKSVSKNVKKINTIFKPKFKYLFKKKKI